MAGLDIRSALPRARMLASLRQLGVTDESVLAAMDAVPRHEFVDRFWTVSSSDTRAPGRTRQCRLAEDCADGVLEAVYDPQSAILIRAGGAGATSRYTSREVLQAEAAVLHVAAAGQGKHVAQVPAVDPELIAPARQRLARLGFDEVVVRCGDGADGAADRAPFDRIAATVGCLDIAAAWVAQLADDGQLLVPLEHGAMHPRVLLRRSGDGEDLVGHFVGRSAFVRMQGSQADHPLWPADMPLPAAPNRAPLPRLLAEALDPDHPSPVPVQRRPWDLSTYIGMRDRRALSGLALGNGTSMAFLRERTVAFEGPQGSALADRLVTLGCDWVGLGCPGLERYALRFTPRQDGVTTMDSAGGPWTIDRIDYRQHVELLGPL